MANLMRRLPVVVILGATGAGKSKAALEIAVKFNGEIISADSMQIYKGLDIVTNKVTGEEQQMVPHHMIDIVSPLKSDFNIHNFKQMVIPKIDRILNDRKLPVIVGGTNYYIESLLWDFLIDNTQSEIQIDTSENKLRIEDNLQQQSNLEHNPSTDNTGLQSKFTDASGQECEKGTQSELNTDKPTRVSSDASASNSWANKYCGTFITEGSNDETNHGLETNSECVNTSSALRMKNLCDLPIEPKTKQESEHSINVSLNKTCSKDTEGAELIGLDSDRKAAKSQSVKEDFSEMSSVELHAKLKEVDPESALRLHPHNKRKIRRALEVYSQHQQPLSKMLKLQHSQQGASEVSGPLRYPNACVIWVQCDQKVLDERTDRRVDKMLADGLLEELEGFHTDYNHQRLQQSGEADYTLGVFQSIGFKEFHNYLLLTPEGRKTEQGLHLLQKGLEDMKLVTRRYARKQKRWIVGRFLKRRGKNVPPVYAVDSTNKEEWKEKVHNPACQIVESFLQEIPPPYSPITAEETRTKFVHNVCQICGGMVFVTLDQWQVHLRSKRHIQNKKRLEHKQENKTPSETVTSS